MTQQEINKYLTEKVFKECWHEVEHIGLICIKCDKNALDEDPNYSFENNDFFSPEGFFKLKEFMEKQEYWDEFLNWNLKKCHVRFGYQYMNMVISLFRKEHFAEIAYEFLKEREG